MESLIKKNGLRMVRIIKRRAKVSTRRPKAQKGGENYASDYSYIIP